jgi:amino acid transporter
MVFYSTGRDGTWHPRINDAFLITHDRFNSPWIATLTAGVPSIAMCAIGLQSLLVITGIVLIYAAVCVAALVGRRTGGTDHAAYRMPLYPFWPMLSLASLGYVVYTSALDPEIGRPSLIINVAIAIVSVGYYAIIVRRKNNFAFRDLESERGAP